MSQRDILRQPSLGDLIGPSVFTPYLFHISCRTYEAAVVQQKFTELRTANEGYQEKQSPRKTWEKNLKDSDETHRPTTDKAGKPQLKSAYGMFCSEQKCSLALTRNPLSRQVTENRQIANENSYSSIVITTRFI